MNVKQAIQSSANVVRITNITAGDVYKRFDTSYDDRVYFGIVKSVHNDGELPIIEAVEYKYEYSQLDIKIKVLTGAKDYALFPATPEDLSQNLGGVIDIKNREIEKKRKEIQTLEAEIKDVNLILSGELMKDLKAMSYSEQTQAAYNEKKAALGA